MLKKLIERWIFNRNLRLAKKRFRKVTESSVYNQAEKLEKQGYIKKILREAGFTGIRLKKDD